LALFSSVRFRIVSWQAGGDGELPDVGKQVTKGRGPAGVFVVTVQAGWMSR